MVYDLWMYSYGCWNIKGQQSDLDRLWAVVDWVVIGDNPIAITFRLNNSVGAISKLEYSRNTSPDMLRGLDGEINKRRELLKLVPGYLQHLDWWGKEKSHGGVVLLATAESIVTRVAGILYSDCEGFTRIYIDGDRLTVALVSDDYASSVGFGSTYISCPYDGPSAEFLDAYVKLKQFDRLDGDTEVLFLHHDWECPVYRVGHNGFVDTGEIAEPPDDLRYMYVARQRWSKKSK